MQWQLYHFISLVCLIKRNRLEFFPIRMIFKKYPLNYCFALLSKDINKKKCFPYDTFYLLLHKSSLSNTFFLVMLLKNWCELLSRLQLKSYKFSLKYDTLLLKYIFYAKFENIYTKALQQR